MNNAITDEEDDWYIYIYIYAGVFYLILVDTGLVSHHEFKQIILFKGSPLQETPDQ